jgi:hypothetical protein
VTDLLGYSIIIKKKKKRNTMNGSSRQQKMAIPSGNILPHFFGRCTIFKGAVDPSNQESGTLGCCGQKTFIYPKS